MQDPDDERTATHQRPSVTRFTAEDIDASISYSHMFAHRLDPETWLEPFAVTIYGNSTQRTHIIHWRESLADVSDRVHAHLSTVISELGGTMGHATTELIEASHELEDTADNLAEDDEYGVDPRVLAVLPMLMSDPQYDPVSYDSDMKEFARARLDDADEDFIREVTLWLLTGTEATEIQDAAEKKFHNQARSILASMPTSLRDRFGFAIKSADKEEITAPFLESDLHGLRRARLNSHIKWAEEEEYATHRESRYATAARELLNRGETKAATARIIGISTSVMNRLLRERPVDVELKADDPLHEALRR